MAKSKKRIILNKIKELLEQTGSLNTSDLEMDHSPMYGQSLGPNVFALAEVFDSDSFGFTVYHGDQEIDTFESDYDDVFDNIDIDDLEEILEKIIKYEKTMEE